MVDGKKMQRPTITPEQNIRLNDAEATLNEAQEVVNDLKEIGVDTAAVQLQIDQNRDISRGLRERFAPGRRRKRAPK